MFFALIGLVIFCVLCFGFCAWFSRWLDMEIERGKKRASEREAIYQEMMANAKTEDERLAITLADMDGGVF